MIKIAVCDDKNEAVALIEKINEIFEKDETMIRMSYFKNASLLRYEVEDRVYFDLYILVIQHRQTEKEKKLMKAVRERDSEAFFLVLADKLEPTLAFPIKSVQIIKKNATDDEIENIIEDVKAAMEKRKKQCYIMKNQAGTWRILYKDIIEPSSKLKACMDIIETAKENNQKVLLFSSFTKSLDLIEAELRKKDISYYVLTGSTTKIKRHQLVNAFQNDQTTVFLISLKAGGTGLNLTSASTVIHYDPWWNMSAQNQATDRAYRIGQTNNVQVYKLIMKNSIEEKIQKLQEQKQDLSNMFIENNNGSITQMSTADIIDLFK